MTFGDVGTRWDTACCDDMAVARRFNEARAFTHLAREKVTLSSIALRTRPLAWWRFHQANESVVHPRKFKAWRWEQQIVDHYGEASTPFLDESVGWMLVAQDRAAWRANESAFAEGT